MTKDPRRNRDLRQYRVHVCSTEYFSIDVLAKNEHHALEIAEQVDGGYFEPSKGICAPGPWEIERAEEIPPGEPFEPLDERHYQTL
jgi:hypothetical protein